MAIYNRRLITFLTFVPYYVSPNFFLMPPDHLLLDSALNFGPLTSPSEQQIQKLLKQKLVELLKSWHLYQQFSNLLISQRDMSAPILGALSNNRWSGGTSEVH